MGEINFNELGCVLESIHPGVTIADSGGVFRFISDSYLKGRDITRDEIIGHHADSKEIAKIFSPCVTKLVLEKGERVTTVQTGIHLEETFVTGIPVYKNGELKLIISYSSWEITGFDDLREQYNILEYENKKLLKEIDRLVRRDSISTPLICESKRTKDAERFLRIFCNAGCPAFVYGEQGSGKTFLASTVYGEGNTLYSYDCSPYNEEVIESELLGNNCVFDRKIKAKAIIKNIDLLSHRLQKILVRKCRNSSVVPVGISTSSLDELKKKGLVTDEFYNMFEAYQVKIYPVNERAEDLNGYIEYFLEKYNKKYSREISFTPRATGALLGCEWKGNIFEIKHTIERIVLTAENKRVDIFNLPEKISGNSTRIYTENASLKDMLEFYESGLVKQAYEKYGTTVMVAKKLGISQATAVRKIQKYVDKDKING